MKSCQMMSEPITAMKITGGTLAKIIAFDPTILERQVKDVWGFYFVKDIPIGVSRTPVHMIIPTDVFHKHFRFTEKRSARYSFAEVERVFEVAS